MMKSNVKTDIIKGLGWVYCEKMIGQLVSLVVSIVLSRQLLPNDYGIIAIVMVFLTFMDAFVNGGFGNALIQKKDATENDFDTICWFSLSFSFVLYIILFFCAPYIALFYEMPLLSNLIRIMGLRVIISAFNSVQNAHIQKEMKFNVSLYSTLGGAIISAFIGIVMAYTGFGVWSLAVQSLTNAIFTTVILFFFCSWKPQFSFSFYSLKSLWGFGSKKLGATLVNTLQDNIRSLIIGKMFTGNDLAYYDQGRKYPSYLMNNLIGSIQKVMFPAFSIEQTNRLEIKSIMRSSIRISTFVISPVILGLIAIADNLIVLLLTGKWIGAIPYFRISCIIYITRTMNTLFQTALLAIGKSSIDMFHETVGAILTVILIIIAVFVFHSVEMVAWSYVLVMLIGTSIYFFFIWKEFRYSILEITSDFCVSTILSGVMSLFVWQIGKLQANLAFLIITQILCGFIVYAVLSFIFNRRDVFHFLHIIKKIIKKGA